MSITVFTMDGCTQCEYLKSALKAKGTYFKAVHLEDAVYLWCGNLEWHIRMDYIEAQAKYCMVDELPITVIDGRAEDFEETLRIFGIPLPEADCEGGSCTL